MTTDHASVERFLAAFHDARPGLTPKAYAVLTAHVGQATHDSSYALLSTDVPHEGRDLAVLDLACGDGYLLSLLVARQQPGLALYGIDLSAGELAAARQRLGDAATLSMGRAQALPYAAGHFDVVLCHMALMLMADVDAVLAEVLRVMRHGGTFAAIVSAPPPPSPALSHWIEMVSGRTRDPQWTAVRFGDRRFRAADTLAQMVSQRFADVEVEEVRLPLRLTPQALWDWLLDCYDLYLLPTADREAIRAASLDGWKALAAADGMLDFAQAMRHVRARAA